ncbi:hypothetical protein A2209_01660 [Candidatus Roizmanbacteria bacterium RIFOXYA1_FULL_41_12]|uniref:Uncharacterized protein n=1 Tax=Candidatus Roizmanbacteria bacterium RIFOXYA1_FULL_41_12 TaxID=1802082 RepID=A0A1F7KF03_9BACT|nr:MAG: hypothetical protein A2209_01660 [Candidatus Roizmanbacteria bacterium RIFOXYA1_FULL_41_12]OGK71943.1 MAG: hypothetical protein A2403_03240 [Candidatus Roizmanbacteria bacterium RIFOXYC1_FULL_41_16]OGK75350.1 MAG: hypothetical protein A2575_01935 [Candidatus Roizmanbacteria bacterium RIFOXYD1_FULL_41_24]
MKTPPETVEKIKAEHPESWDASGNYIPNGIPEVGSPDQKTGCRATGCEYLVLITIFFIGVVSLIVILTILT